MVRLEGQPSHQINSCQWFWWPQELNKTLIHPEVEQVFGFRPQNKAADFMIILKCGYLKVTVILLFQQSAQWSTGGRGQSGPFLGRKEAGQGGAHL